MINQVINQYYHIIYIPCCFEINKSEGGTNLIELFESNLLMLDKKIKKFLVSNKMSIFIMEESAKDNP